MSDNRKDKTGIGYGRPPHSGQFKPGRSGNLKGRPKKQDPAIFDLDAILTSNVQVNGTLMDSREVELRQQVKKALEPKGSLKVIRYLLVEFERHGAIVAPRRRPIVHELPHDIPNSVGRIGWLMYGPPPWSAKKLNAAKQHYLAGRNDGDRIYDREMGHEEWLNE